jgi:decaprenyl-phosphate phosphoribosyltransferase
MTGQVLHGEQFGAEPRKVWALIAGSASEFARALRPKQWLKNLMVGAAPLAAGSLIGPERLENVTLAFLAFCAASSAGYLVNDLVDLEVDRRHPDKRHRPLAAGTVSPSVALAAAVALGAWAVWFATVAVRWQLGLVVAVYLLSTVSYSLWVKTQPVFDLALVAAGFLLRAIAGGVAADVQMSSWFLLAASFGSLFMVAGKRYADVELALRTQPRQTGEPAVNGRQAEYSPSYLRFVWAVSATATVIVYALWSLSVGVIHREQVWALLSVAPFTLGILRYAVDIDRGTAGAPEDVVLRDRGLQVLAVLWLVLFTLAARAA